MLEVVADAGGDAVLDVFEWPRMLAADGAADFFGGLYKSRDAFFRVLKEGGQGGDAARDEGVGGRVADSGERLECTGFRG